MTTSDTTHNSYPKEKVECNYTKRESARAKKKTKKHKKAYTYLPWYRFAFYILPNLHNDCEFSRETPEMHCRALPGQHLLVQKKPPTAASYPHVGCTT
jgi:hypothetical protein